MALSTVDAVRQRLGINDELSHELFGLPDEAALDAMVEDELAVATAYLTSKAGTNYTQTADTNLQALMARAEIYFVGMQIAEPLKARKVFGTHAPYDSEESLSYQRLIDEEWQAKFEMLTGPYVSDDTGSPYSLGVFVVSESLDRTTDVDCITDQYDDLLAEVNCWGLPR